MDVTAYKSFPDCRGEIRIDADRGRERIIRIFLHEGIDFPYKFLHTGRCVLCAQSGEIHHRKAGDEDVIGCHVVNVCRNDIKTLGDFLRIWHVTVFFK